MFWRNVKNSIKVLFREKMLIFWTFAFPIILGLLFNMAFSDLEKKDKLEVFDIAIIDNQALKENEHVKDAFDTLSSGDNKIFNIKYVNNDDAKRLLDNDEVAGYLELKDNDYNITINSNGIDQTIFKYTTEEIINTISLTSNLMNKKVATEIENGNYNVDYNKIIEEVNKIVNDNKTEIKDNSANKLSYTMIEYYTLIAMACLYGGTIAASTMNNCLANMSGKGKRISVSPVPERVIVLSGLVASYIVQLLGLLILFLFTIFILHVDYGDNLLYMILLALCGSFAGLSLGIAVSVLFKTNEGNKIGILIAVTMFFCFLSGMMGVTLKYVIDKNIPFLNLINPAAMITDGFYALYYYSTPNRYIFDMISLLIFSAVLIIISYRELRRQKYDSI